MKSLARWGSLPLLGLPLSSWALGLDEIELNSYLNQPLNAEIPYTATPEERTSLSVALAPVEAFERAGLQYPSFLTSIQFEIGQDVIRVRSTQPVREPFVTMLVQVSHARGSTTREYSVLLDPPLFLTEGAEPQAIQAPVTRAPDPVVAGGQIQRTPVTPQPTPSPQQQVQTEPPVQPQPAAPAPAPATGDYTVQTGDTLWGIASSARPAGVSINQAMISIFESNPNAFEGNINRLRRGAILRIPPVSALGGVAVAEANAEVQRQIDAWRNNVATSPQLVLLPPSDDASPANVAGGADAAASARVSALENEVDRLGADLANRDTELAEAQRLLELRSQELADLQRQLDESAAVEVAPAPEVEVADEPLFVDEAEPAAGEVEAAVDEVEAVADEVEPAQVAETAPPVVPQATEPTLLDRALELAQNRYVWMGGGGVLLALLLLAFLRRRGGEAEDVTGQWEALEAELDEEADHAATARLRAQAEESNMVVVEGHDADITAEEPKLGGTTEIEALGQGTAEIEALDRGTAEIESIDSGTAEVESLLEPKDDLLGLGEAFAEPDPEPAPTREAPAEPTISEQTLSSQTVINLDQADPIAEADFHMAYGLYDQAADLISKALAADPDNREFKLKLLEVYFVWGNKELFLESATGLHKEIGQGGNPDWDKVVIMGKQICPDESMFADATAGAAEVDLDLESSGASAGLDFAFDADEDDSLDLAFVDEDSAADSKAGPSDEDAMLDIGARTQAGLEAALFEDTDQEGEKTTPGEEISDLDATMESPTVSTESADFGEALTLESPTIEAEGPDAPTVETPTIEAPAPDEPEAGDTVEHVRPAAAAGGTVEMTAELEIDDLGLDVGDLDDLPHDIADLPGVDDAGGDVGEQTVHPDSVDPDDDLLSATGVTQVLDQQDAEIEHTATAIIGDDDATMMAPGLDSSPTGTTTEVLEQPPSDFNPDPIETEDDLDLNLDDFSSALEGADTVEQPRAAGMDGLDLDVGADVTADDEPTGTEEVSPLDPQTMTEVGTKLDLARAYIDMGDPEGAKSILEEVLGEGDTGQRSEAQALIDALPG